MICLDSNIFLIDRFFKRDVHYAVNRRLVARLPALEVGLSIYSLLEICGLASFNLSSDELARWFYNFDRYYPLKILLPIGLDQTAEQYFTDWLTDLHQMFVRRMTFADAAILSTAEQYGASHFVTWNKRHFEGRTAIPVMTPDEFMATLPAQ